MSPKVSVGYTYTFFYANIYSVVISPQIMLPNAFPKAHIGTLRHSFRQIANE
jgi:hypothetical protein